MSVKIRLTRRGRKKMSLYDIVIADARSPRDGKFIEKIGTYNPLTNPATIEMDNERALKWLLNGAQPTPTVKAMLSYRGVLYKKHLQVGVLKGAITQEQADEKYNAWIAAKESKISNKVDTLAKQKEADAKARLDAETKIKENRAEELKKKQAVVENTSVESAEAVSTEENNATESAE